MKISPRFQFAAWNIGAGTEQAKNLVNGSRAVRGCEKIWLERIGKRSRKRESRKYVWAANGNSADPAPIACSAHYAAGHFNTKFSTWCWVHNACLITADASDGEKRLFDTVFANHNTDVRPRRDSNQSVVISLELVLYQLKDLVIRNIFFKCK